MESPLRDLARKLRQTASEHGTYSQVVELVAVIDSYLNAMAYCEEMNRAIAREEGGS